MLWDPSLLVLSKNKHINAVWCYKMYSIVKRSNTLKIPLFFDSTNVHVVRKDFFSFPCTKAVEIGFTRMALLSWALNRKQEFVWWRKEKCQKSEDHPTDTTALWTENGIPFQTVLFSRRFIGYSRWKVARRTVTWEILFNYVKISYFPEYN